MNILFVCSMARLRSKTAHTLYQAPPYNGICRYAGTDNDADKPVTQDDMDWADLIVCMEMRNKSKLRRRFKGYSSKMVVWGIPDVYTYMDTELVDILKGKFGRL